MPSVSERPAQTVPRLRIAARFIAPMVFGGNAAVQTLFDEQNIEVAGQQKAARQRTGSRPNRARLTVNQPIKPDRSPARKRALRRLASSGVLGVIAGSAALLFTEGQPGASSSLLRTAA